MNNTHIEKIFDEIQDDFQLIPTHLQEWWLNYLKNHRNHYYDLLSLIDSKGKSKKILEVGVVPAHFTVLLKKLGNEVTGMDLEPQRIEKFLKKHELDVKKVDIEKELFPFQNEYFDYVIFAELLEHLRLNPLKPLMEASRVLKKNGTLILSTPNITPLMKIDFLMDESEYQGDIVEEISKIESIGHMGHFRLYTKNEIKKIMNRLGLKIDQIFYGGLANKPNSKQKFLILTLRTLGKRFSNEEYRPHIYLSCSKKD